MVSIFNATTVDANILSRRLWTTSIQGQQIKLQTPNPELQRNPESQLRASGLIQKPVAADVSRIPKGLSPPAQGWPAFLFRAVQPWVNLPRGSTTPTGLWPSASSAPEALPARRYAEAPLALSPGL